MWNDSDHNYNPWQFDVCEKCPVLNKHQYWNNLYRICISVFRHIVLKVKKWKKGKYSHPACLQHELRGKKEVMISSSALHRCLYKRTISVLYFLLRNGCLVQVACIINKVRLLAFLIEWRLRNVGESLLANTASNRMNCDIRKFHITLGSDFLLMLKISLW